MIGIQVQRDAESDNLKYGAKSLDDRVPVIQPWEPYEHHVNL